MIGENSLFYLCVSILLILILGLICLFGYLYITFKDKPTPKKLLIERASKRIILDYIQDKQVNLFPYATVKEITPDDIDILCSDKDMVVGMYNDVLYMLEFNFSHLYVSASVYLLDDTMVMNPNDIYLSLIEA